MQSSLQPSHIYNAKKERFIYHCLAKKIKNIFSNRMVNKTPKNRINKVNSSFAPSLLGFFLVFFLPNQI